MANLILIGGGQRSGKSRFALQLAERVLGMRVFIATAEAHDAEMQARILRHQRERADRFITEECPRALPDAILRHADASVIVIDCLSLWLSNLLGLGLANEAILDAIDRLIVATQQARAEVLLVTNEVGMGLVSLNELGRRFQDLSGWAHQRLSSTASEIYLATLGCVLRIKPNPIELIVPVT
ncbi:MAG TPA: bifunctional adenosylcobinamide kinase/adenosylcobinamide-phosphate guanylyltransferase [Polyangiaceae bacterium]